MEKWVYFVIQDDGKEILRCCIRQEKVKKAELQHLDDFLAYYGQNYKLFILPWEEGADVYCNNMQEVRTAIIDKNKNAGE